MYKYIILLIISFLYIHVGFTQEVQTGRSGMKFVNTNIKNDRPKCWFLEYNLAINKDVMSPVGVKVGWVKKSIGFYLKGIWNGKYAKTLVYSGYSHDNGTIEGVEDKVTFTGNRKIYEWSVVGGLMQNLYKGRLYCYLGGGFGKFDVMEEYDSKNNTYNSTSWYRNVDKSIDTSYALDFGLSCKLNKTLMVSLGGNTIKMKQFDVNIGIGIFL